MDDEIKKFRRATRRKKSAEGVTPPAAGLSSGCTLLNLASTGDPRVCFLPGKYYYLVGDAASGKTWLSLTCFAEAQLNPLFQGHRLIYDDVEGGALMDMERYFGRRVADRIEPPARTADGRPCYSERVEEFYFHVDDAVKQGTPFIYVLDSMDSLGTVTQEDKSEQVRKAMRKRKEGEAVKMPADYGLGKAKANSAELRRVVARLRDESPQSILLIISQTRDAIGSPFGGKTRAGGNALEFYSTAIFWTSIKQRLKRTVRDKERHIGNLVKIHTKRTRHTGRESVIEIPLYWSSGIDDIGGCVRFLLTEKHWQKGRGGVNATEFDFRGSEEALVQHLDQTGRREELIDLVHRVWEEIRQSLQVDRVKRYE